ncbi:hypothetical protein [Streptomyces sp. NPDC002845]
MHKFKRHALLPLSAVTVAALLATGCSSGSPAAVEPASATSSAAPERPQAEPAGERLAVVPAPSGSATPTAVAEPGAGSGERGRAKESAVKVASYDRKSGRAVISAAVGGAGRSGASAPSGESRESGESGSVEGSADPSKTPAPAPSEESSDQAAPDAPVAVGDVIASAPVPGAPDGVLAEVTEIVGEAEDGGTEVRTEPAQLNSVLGESKAEGTVPIDPAAVEVEPLLQGVKVSWAKTGGLTFGSQGAKLPLGSLRIDVGAAIATAEGAPASASASVKGFVQLAPEVAFFYDGSGDDTGSSPGGAFLGLSGDWASQWSLKGRAAGSTNGKPVRIPFAELHTNPVIQVGPVPIVVNLDLVCYFQVDADGSVTVDVEQDLKGDFRVGGTFSWAKGWTPVNESRMTGDPLKVSVAAVGDVKAALGAEASIGLYGTVGVTADLAPYLRAHVDAAAEGSADGTGSAIGAWALYGGIDLSGALRLQLTIFGTPIFQTKIPLGTLHREWLLTEGKGVARQP